MKKFLFIFLLLNFIGCASISIPNYIQDKNPYKKIFYAPFDKVQEVVKETFEETGWKIERESEPALFEQERDLKSGKKQTLLFSEVRQTSFFIGSRYTRINAYLHELADNETEVEIRYLTVTSITSKSFYGYKNDSAVEHLFSKVEEKLNF